LADENPHPPVRTHPPPRVAFQTSRFIIPMFPKQQKMKMILPNNFRLYFAQKNGNGATKVFQNHSIPVGDMGV
jgi:hypothetical protein